MAANLEESSPDYQTVMRLLEAGEKITHMYRCARIQGLDTTEGLLLFGKERSILLQSWRTPPYCFGTSKEMASFVQWYFKVTTYF